MRHSRAWGVPPLGLVIAALALGACSSAVQEQGTTTTSSTVVTSSRLTLGATGGFPRCLPVGLPMSNSASLLANLLLPSPFSLRSDGSLQPNLDLLQDGRAEVVKTKPFTVVYAINPKARWSTKAAIRAGDFVAAWRVRAISSRPEFAPYRQISSVTTAHHGLLATVTFAQPYADWRALFSQLIPKAMEPVPGQTACIRVQAGFTPSGTAWELSSTNASSVSLGRAPHWWGSEQAFSTVSLLNAPNATVLADWANRHVVDVASVADPDANTISAASAARGVTRRLALSSRLLDLEFQSTSGPTQNKVLRRGLIAALDRQQVTTQLFGQASLQYTPAASHLFAPNVSAYPSNLYQSPVEALASTPASSSSKASSSSRANLQRAAKLLRKAGYHIQGDIWEDAMGMPLHLTLATSNERVALQAALALVSQFKAFGIAVTLQSCRTSEQAGRNLRAGKVDLALVFRPISPLATLSADWYSTATGASGKLDYSGFNDPEVNALFLEASQELNPVVAQEEYQQIDDLLWLHAPSLPISFVPMLWSARQDLKGPSAPLQGFSSAEINTWQRLQLVEGTATSLP